MRENLIDNIALCICTRHRPESIGSVLAHLETLLFTPRICLIIDSSDDIFTRDIVAQHSKISRNTIKYLRALPGLPHQRNIGIEFLITNEVLKQDGIVSFLDDDVRVGSDYFKNVSELFDQNRGAVAIGGFVDEASKANSNTLLRRLALLGSRDNGVILRSGVAMAPFPNKKIMETQWIPGGMQNIRIEVFKHELFDGRIRMYGEDVEFYLRISKLGTVLCSNLLPVKHLEAVEEKDDLRKIHCFTDGFRWTMALNRKGGVKKYAVLFSTAVMIIADIFLLLFKHQKANKQSMLGHFDFIRNIIRGCEVQQYVDHNGS